MGTAQSGKAIAPPDAASLRVGGSAGRGERLTFRWNGRGIEAWEGETPAAALLAAGEPVLRRSEQGGAPRGLFCGMGHCWECRVHVAGRGVVRACTTPAAPGLEVTRPGPLED